MKIPLALILLISALAVVLVAFGMASAHEPHEHPYAGIDENHNGLIDRNEAIGVLRAYLSGEAISHPSGTPEPTPTPTPSDDGECTIPDNVDLATTDCANLWIAFQQSNISHTYLRAIALPHFDIGAFDLEVFADGTEYCNGARMYSGEVYELGCGFEEKHHTDVVSVSANTTDVPDLLGDLRCVRNYQSDAETSYFACVWR